VKAAIETDVFKMRPLMELSLELLDQRLKKAAGRVAPRPVRIKIECFPNKPQPRCPKIKQSNRRR
jgi:hypothetical protein